MFGSVVVWYLVAGVFAVMYGFDVCVVDVRGFVCDCCVV